MLACLDELPSTAPLPTLRTRMANERALGISIIFAAQTRRQLDTLYGDTEARAIVGLTNVLVMFGGSKDVAFNEEVSKMVGTTRVARTTWQMGGSGGRSSHGDDMAILTPEEVMRLPEKHALIVAENAKPMIAKLSRCVEGPQGAKLLAQQAKLRAEMATRRAGKVSADARAVAASASTRRRAE